MKNTLFLTMMAAALLGSGVANAAINQTLYASSYTGDEITLGTGYTYNTLVVDKPLTLTGEWGYLDLYDGATIQFQKEQAAEAICSIFSSASISGSYGVYFNNRNAVYNFTFDAGAQTVVAASAGKAITLIEDLNMRSGGFSVAPTATFTLNGAVVGQTVNMNGVQFTYVGPQSSDYAFKEGEIGFTGYAQGSRNLSLVVGGSVPEPTTGTLSLLALVALAARRRRK